MTTREPMPELCEHTDYSMCDETCEEKARAFDAWVLRQLGPEGQERLRNSTLTKTTSEVTQMLILTRRPTQVVMIGDDIRVYVLGVNGNQVRMGFEVPKNIPVHREEIYERIRREQSGGDVDGNK